MTDAHDESKLDGLARSIDALFGDRGAGGGDRSKDPSGSSEEGYDPSPDDVGDAAGSDAAGEHETEPDPFLTLEGEEPASAADPEVQWEPVEHEPAQPEGDGPARADPEALREALDRFLASPPLEREGQAREIREIVAALKAANAFDALADAVERIVREAGDDEAALALMDLMVTPGVATRLVARLGVARDESRRAELIRVCRAVGLEMAMALADALSDTSDRFARRTFMDAMVAMGPTAVVVLETMLEDPRWFVVRNAVDILGEVGGERAAELVTSALAHTDARVRREALLALAKLHVEDAGMLVAGMLEDPDPDVRTAAAVAAGELGVERALKPLLTLLDDTDDQEFVVAALGALGKLGDPGAVQNIERLAVGSFFKKPPADVRIAAYRALHRIGTPRARSLLQEASEDKDPQVRAAVRELLEHDREETALTEG